MSAHPFYVDDVFAVYHPAAAPAGTAVLLCPLLGWDDMSSHRPRRDWADHLAAAGHPVLRFDLPGTGDSAGGAEDPDLVEAWTAAVEATARWLAHETGGRLAAIGAGLGGQLALRAVAAGAPIDEAVLWGVPAHGRALVREVRAFARLETATIVAAGAPEPPPLPEGSFAPGGFLLSAETTAALAALDARATPVPERVLLLDRDGLALDGELRSHLEGAGAEVTVARGRGYGAMVDSPADAKAPRPVYAVVDRWLADGPAATPRAISAPPALDLLVLGAVRERPLVVEQPFGSLIGVLAEPTDAPAASLALVLLNAGAMRRIGPNRFWVDIARRWAARGVPTLRFDLIGIGDSDGPSERYGDVTQLYVPGFMDQIQASLAALEAEGLARRFVVGGLCSGGYWAFQAALEDDRVVQALLINGGYFFYDTSLDGARMRARIRRRIFHLPTWRRLLRGGLELDARTAALALFRRAPETGRALAAAFDLLQDRGARLDMIFCDGEPLREELAEVGPLDPWPNVRVGLVPGRDHLFRPLWMHEPFHAAVDRALRRALDSEHAPADRAPVPAPVGDGRPQRHA
jgi:alpha-beta hydrolase superfamily lysophospholipase